VRPTRDPGLRDPGLRDRGAVALLVLLVALAVSGVAIVATVRVADVLVAADRARTAADAAALAGVLHGRGAADRVAAANGAVVVAWESVDVESSHGIGAVATDSPSVEVIIEVRVGNALATARATNAP
jgi:hypothetical protein